MAAALRRFWSLSSPLFHAQRSLSTAVVINAKAKAPDDPIKKLFLEKLNEFNSKGNIAMSSEVQKQFDEEISRLKRIYGADKEDLSQFPNFTYEN